MWLSNDRQVGSRRSGDAWAERHWQGYIAALIYPVICAPDPLEHVEAALAEVVGKGCLGAFPREYRRVLRYVRTHDHTVSTILPQPHGETTLREYLARLERALDEGRAKQTLRVRMEVLAHKIRRLTRRLTSWRR